MKVSIMIDANVLAFFTSIIAAPNKNPNPCKSRHIYINTNNSKKNAMTVSIWIPGVVLVGLD
jgi:hypothetical protein